MIQIISIFILLVLLLCNNIYLRNLLYRYKKLTKLNIKNTKKLLEQRDIYKNKCHEYDDLCKKQHIRILELKKIVDRQENTNSTLSENNIVYYDLDDILRRISTNGIKSLTEDEIDFLKSYGNDTL